VAKTEGQGIAVAKSAVVAEWCVAQGPVAGGNRASHPALVAHGLRRQVTPAASAFRDQAEIVHLNRAVGTLFGAQAAADAPVFDADFAVVAAVDRADRATGHADGIKAGAARG